MITHIATFWGGEREREVGERDGRANLHGSEGLHALLGQRRGPLLDVFRQSIGLLRKGETELLIRLLLLHLCHEGGLSLGHRVQHLAPLVVHQLW